MTDTDLVVSHCVFTAQRMKRKERNTDLVVSHCVLEVGVKTGSELQQPGPLGLQRGHVGLHDACGRVPVQNQGTPFLLHCVEVTLTRLQLTDETLEARKSI